MDGLRGIGILVVVLAHTTVYWLRMTQRTPLEVPLLDVNLLDLVLVAYVAVPMFFMLSGYLLTWSEEARRRRGTYSVLNYAKRRVLRIVPAYYVAIVVVILLWASEPPSFGSVAVHLTFLHGFVPVYPHGLDPAFWSLTPELVFYAALPLLVLRFRTFSQRVAILVILWLVSLVTRLLHAYDVFGLSSLDEGLGEMRMYFFPTTTLYFFLVGVVLRMIVERRAEASHEPGRHQLFVASALTVIPLAVLLMFPYLVMQQLEVLNRPTNMIPEAMIVLLFASVLLGSPILNPILRWKPVVFCGQISYSWFLLHTTVIRIITTHIRPTVRSWLPYQGELMVWATFFSLAFVILAVTATLGYLSYRYIESPFMRIKPK